MNWDNVLKKYPSIIFIGDKSVKTKHITLNDEKGRKIRVNTFTGEIVAREKL